jgi:hypothetical protein
MVPKLIGSFAGSEAGRTLSGENFYERASAPELAAEIGLGFAGSMAGEALGKGIDKPLDQYRNDYRRMLREGMDSGQRQLVEALDKQAAEAGEGFKGWWKGRKPAKEARTYYKEAAKKVATKAAGSTAAKTAGQVAGKAAVGRLGALGGAKLGAALGTATFPGIGTAVGAGLGLLGGSLLGDAIMPDSAKAVEDDPGIDSPGPSDPYGNTLRTGILGTAAITGLALSRPKMRQMVGIDKLPVHASSRYTDDYNDAYKTIQGGSFGWAIPRTRAQFSAMGSALERTGERYSPPYEEYLKHLQEMNSVT